jgi:hypothetical protein
VLQFHRVVKGVLYRQRVLVFLGQFCALDKPLIGATPFVVVLDFFGAHPGFAFEFLSRHEEVEQGLKGPIDGGQERLFLETREPVISHVFTDDGTVFLFNSDHAVRKQLAFFLWS